MLFNHGFDLLNVRDDHFALEVHVDFTFLNVGIDRKKLHRGMSWDFRALDCPDVQAELAAAIDAREITSVPWDWDVNKHAQFLSSGIVSALDEVLPKKEDTPKSSYIPIAAWKLRNSKLRLKKLTANRKANFREDALRLAWNCFVGAARGDFKPGRLELRKCIMLYELVASAVQVTTMFMKQLIRNIKNEILDTMVRQLGHHGQTRSCQG